MDIQKSDVIGKSAYTSLFSDCIETRPGRVFDTFSTGLRWLDASRYESAARKCDDAYAGLGLVYAISDVASLCAETQKCAEVACEKGFASMDFLGASRGWTRSACGLVSDGYAAAKFFEVEHAVIDKLGPVAPVCDVVVYASDVYDNIDVLMNDPKDEVEKKYWWHNFWEAGKNGLYLGGAVVSALGIAFSAGALFALSVVTLMVSIIAFFTKQAFKEEYLNSKGKG